jgi:hypothetical protein
MGPVLVVVGVEQRLSASTALRTGHATFRRPCLTIRITSKIA